MKILRHVMPTPSPVRVKRVQEPTLVTANKLYRFKPFQAEVFQAEIFIQSSFPQPCWMLIWPIEPTERHGKIMFECHPNLRLQVYHEPLLIIFRHVTPALRSGQGKCINMENVVNIDLGNGEITLDTLAFNLKDDTGGCPFHKQNISEICSVNIYTSVVCGTCRYLERAILYFPICIFKIKNLNLVSW